MSHTKGLERMVAPAVETEVKGDSKRANERDPFLAGSLGLSYTRDFCSALAASVRYKIFFSSSHTISISLSKSPSKLGRQPCRASIFQCTSLVPQNKCILVLCST